MKKYNGDELNYSWEKTGSHFSYDLQHYNGNNQNSLPCKVESNNSNLGVNAISLRIKTYKLTGFLKKLKQYLTHAPIKTRVVIKKKILFHERIRQ